MPASRKQSARKFLGILLRGLTDYNSQIKTIEIMKTYRTRISVGLVVFIIVVLLVCFLPGILGEGGWRMLISLCLVAVPMFYLLYAIKYTIDGTTLKVTVLSIFTDKYDLTKLVSVVPTRTILSAPASSLKRIRLDFSAMARPWSSRPVIRRISSPSCKRSIRRCRLMRG